jgi:hypothetical protein
MSDITEALREEHQALLPHIDELRVIADRLGEMPAARDSARLGRRLSISHPAVDPSCGSGRRRALPCGR